MSAVAEQQQTTGTERMTYREALRLAMREELARDERVFIMGEEVGVFEGSYKVTAGLMDEFGPERVRDTPISEEGFVGAAVGAAMVGERPVVEIMTINFLLVAMDQVVNHAAKVGAMFGGEVGCPMVIRTPNGAGNQLTAQHSQSLEAWFAAHARPEGRRARQPGRREGPAEVRDPRRRPRAGGREPPDLQGEGRRPARPRVPDADRPRRGRRARARTSRSCRTRSRPCARCTSPRAAEEHGVNAEVVDLRSLRPLDVETVAESVAKTNRVVCVEEGWPSYGVTAELAARIQKACFDYLDAPVERVGMAEVPLPYAKNLESAALPGEERVERAVLATLGIAG